MMIPNECPSCGEPDPIFYPPEEADEDGYVECPECWWSKVIPNRTIRHEEEDHANAV